MNTNEGIRRIARATQFIGEFIAAICVIAIVAQPFVDSHDKIFAAGMSAVGGGLAYGVFRGLGWIIAGFAKD